MRSNYCGAVNEQLIDEKVTICGWVHKRRDHGGVIFADIRDISGVVQAVFHPDLASTFKLGEQLRPEYVVRLTGLVRARPAGTINTKIPSGKIEIEIMHGEILNSSDTPIFPIDEYHDISEEVRLKYRYLDLRRPEMQKNFLIRAKANRLMRNFLEEHGFLEIETPFLTKTTPEGSRDYLVPSRIHPGHFYALAQSPQIFKQTLMMGGMDRYYQIVRCFRDEDLRADRQPEFTQLDLEASFVNSKDIIELIETMLQNLFREILQVELGPFPRMSYQTAIQKYGIDRPDLRNPLILVDVDDLVRNVEFKVFADAANQAGNRVVALCVPGGEQLSRKNIDDYTKLVGNFGAKGLAYIRVVDPAQGLDGLQSPILKFLKPEAINGILDRVQAKAGDIIFFAADKAQIVNDSMSALRLRIGEDLKLTVPGWKPLWVVDFPMFEKDKTTGAWTSVHHPFTAPSASIEEVMADPGAALSEAYDVVLNGIELGGGSIRIHNWMMQKAVFKVLGLTEEEIETKFGHLIKALRFGCPPHGGLALGLDRIIMLMCGAKSIREVIAFPKTQTGTCPFTDAPALAEAEQLKDLGIKIISLKK